MKKRMLVVLGALTLASSTGCAGYVAAETGPQTRVVYIERRPPVARVEVISVAPGPGYVWVAGYWNWGGAQYYWIPGRYVMPPQRVYTVWVPDRWAHSRGRGWHRTPGHWKRR